MTRLLWTKAKTWLVKEWPLLALLAAAFYLHWDMLEHLPRSGDHHCHFFKGWLLAEHLIPSGRLTGWTHMAFAGYPSGLYYPIGGDLYLLAIRLLTFGATSWETVFKLALFSLMAASPAVIYKLARKSMNSTWAALAGVFALGDVGGFRQGGSIHTLYWGVWPFALSVIVAYLTLLAFRRALDRRGAQRSLGPILLAAVLLASSLFAHPMAVVYLVVALPALFVCLVAFDKGRSALPVLLSKALIVGGVSLLLAAFWLVPYVIESQEMSIDIGTKWFDFDSLIEKGLKNELVKNLHPIAYIAGFVGAAFGLLSRRVWPAFWSLSSLGVVGAALLGGKYFDDMIQYERLAAYFKGGWYVLGAYGFARSFHLFGRVTRTFREGLEPVKAWKVRLFTHLVGAGIILIVVSYDWDKQFKRIPEFYPMDEKHLADLKRAGEWLSAQPRISLDRVLFQAGEICIKGNLNRRGCRRAKDNHQFESAPIYTGLPKMRFGFQPAEGFEKLPLPRHLGFARLTVKEYLSNPVVFENFGIRWVVSLVDFHKRPDLKLVKKFKRLRIYEVQSRPKPVKLIGKGKIELVEFADEKIVVDVLEAAPDALVQYAVAHHPYWHATVNGKPRTIEVRSVTRKLRRKLLMAVPADKGRIVLTFERPDYAVATSWASAVAWSSVFFLGLGNFIWWRVRKRRPVASTSKPVAKTRDDAEEKTGETRNEIAERNEALRLGEPDDSVELRRDETRRGEDRETDSL